MFKNLGNIVSLIGDVKKIENLTSELRTRLSNIRVESEVAGGAVKAVANGNGKLISLSIEDIDDKKALEGLLINCINDVQQKAKESLASEMTKIGDIKLPDGIEGILKNFIK